MAKRNEKAARGKKCGNCGDYYHRKNDKRGGLCEDQDVFVKPDSKACDVWYGKKFSRKVKHKKNLKEELCNK